MDLTTLNDAAVHAFLADRFGGGIAEVTSIGHGEWSRAFSYGLGGREYVIRFSKVREDFAKDQFAARFATPALPIPRVIELGEAFGGFYAVAARATGAYLDDLDEAGMRRALPALLTALDAARLADLRGTAGYGGWSADGDAPHPSWRAALLEVANDRPTDRVHGWRAALAASRTGIAPFDEALACLGRLVEVCPEDRWLIHSDLLNFNVLVAGDRVSAVLDWGCAMYGDFLYDLAWLSFWSPWYPAWQAIDFRAEAARHFAELGLAVPHFAERLRCCELHIGLGNLGYSAFKGRWDQVEAVARRTLAIAHARG